MNRAPRCGARTRSGKPCQSPAVRGKRRVSNAWWRGWKRRPHRQHERTPAWSLYRRGHRSPASAIRADRDGADYPRRDRRAEIAERRRADRTTAQAPARSWSKARFGPSLEQNLNVQLTRLEKLRIPFQAYETPKRTYTLSK